MAVMKLNTLITQKINDLAGRSLDVADLEQFALFVIENHKKKDPKPKPLTLTQLKEAIYQYFEVNDTTELKRSGSFKMATDGMDLNLSQKESWERMYRKFIGILPGEDGEKGPDCINGINIFKYFHPWRVFGLDPKVATKDDIKRAYRELQKKYHPDMGGDPRISERLTIMYKSICAEP